MNKNIPLFLTDILLPYLNQHGGSSLDLAMLTCLFSFFFKKKKHIGMLLEA